MLRGVRQEPRVFARTVPQERVLARWDMVKGAIRQKLGNDRASGFAAFMLREFTLTGSCFFRARTVVRETTGVDETERGGKGRKALFGFLKKAEALGWAKRYRAERHNGAQSSNDYDFNGLLQWIKTMVLDVANALGIPIPHNPHVNVSVCPCEVCELAEGYRQLAYREALARY